MLLWNTGNILPCFIFKKIIKFLCATSIQNCRKPMIRPPVPKILPRVQMRVSRSGTSHRLAQWQTAHAQLSPVTPSTFCGTARFLDLVRRLQIIDRRRTSSRSPVWTLCIAMCGEVYRLDFSRAQTNGSGGAVLALVHRHAFADNFRTWNYETENWTKDKLKLSCHTRNFENVIARTETLKNIDLHFAITVPSAK